MSVLYSVDISIDDSDNKDQSINNHKKLISISHQKSFENVCGLNSRVDHCGKTAKVSTVKRCMNYIHTTSVTEHGSGLPME